MDRSSAHALVAMQRERRLNELRERGMNAHIDEVLADIRLRDERDAGRDAAPLRQAPDAHLLDTSEMTAEEAVGAAVALVSRCLERA